MSSEAAWKRSRLGDLAKDCRYGYTASATDAPNGPQLLRITDIVGDLDWESVPFVEASEEEVERYMLQDGDLVIARTGANVGVSAHIANPPSAVFASYLVRFRFDRTQISDRFVGYVLKSPLWTDYVQAAHTGSGQPQLNATIMKDFEFPLPSFEEQRLIAAVLGALDDKIKVNQRIAKTAEEIAAAAFRARFVDFIDRGDLVESEIGPVPRGWEVGEVGEVLHAVGGGTPSTKEPEFWDGGTHCWATPKDLSGLDEPVIVDTARHITDAGVDRISSGLLPPRTVLMSSRAPVGYTAISFTPVAINQGFIAVPPSDDVPSEYTLFWMRSNMDRIKANAGGTTFAEISKRAFRPLPILVPPKEELDGFRTVAEPLISRIAATVWENASLSAVRDALLPRLITGQIRVPPDTGLAAEVS